MAGGVPAALQSAVIGSAGRLLQLREGHRRLQLGQRQHLGKVQARGRLLHLARPVLVEEA
jgi:hypothetical protein